MAHNCISGALITWGSLGQVILYTNGIILKKAYTQWFLADQFGG
jgi:hypothetical protein